MLWYDIIYKDDKIKIFNIHDGEDLIIPLLKDGIYILKTFSWCIIPDTIINIITKIKSNYNYSKYLSFLINSLEEYES